MGSIVINGFSEHNKSERKRNLNMSKDENKKHNDEICVKQSLKRIKVDDHDYNKTSIYHVSLNFL